MPIEFTCPHCEALLRIPDSMAGLAARCPECGESFWTPESGASSTFSPVAHGGLDVSEASDATVNTDRRRRRVLERDANSKKASFFEILEASWSIYRQNFGICLIAASLDALLSILAFFLSLIPLAVLAAILPGNRQFLEPMILIASLVVFLTVMSSMTWGHHRFFLALCRGETLQPHEIFAFRSGAASMGLASLMYWTLIGIGLFLCVIPSLLVAIFLWPYGRLIVDCEMGAVAAIRTAGRLTGAQPGVAALIFFTQTGIFFAAMAAPVAGFLLVGPFLAILHTVAYLHMCGEFVAGKQPSSDL